LAALTLAAGVLLARRGRPEALAMVPAAAYLGQGLVGINDLSLDWTLWLSAGILATASLTPELQADQKPAARIRAEPGLIMAGIAMLVVLAVGLTGLFNRVGTSRALGLGQAYIAVHSGAAAVPLLRDVVARDPRRPEHWANYGEALDSIGSAAAAAQAFQEAIRLDPRYPLHWRNLAIELGRLGNIPGAYAAAEKAVAADQWDPESLDLVAQLALSRGDADRAARAGAEAAKIEPNNLARYDAPVLAMLSLQRFREAESLLDTAFENGGADNAVMRLRRAQLYAATSRKDLALKDLEAALIIDPKNADAAKLKQDLSK
jgi:Tfp pilus assembly protein PilF